MVLRKIIKEVNDQSTNFNIVVDSTQDIQRKEQQSICVQYVIDTLQIKEFLELYNIDSTSGLSISAMILDLLIWLQLSIENLRSEIYGGAANMAEKFHGCQVEIKKHQPLACFVSCGPHVTQLVVCKAFQEAIEMHIRPGILKLWIATPNGVCTALDHIHEFDKLYTQSGKFKNLYLALHGDDVETPQPGLLKPICSTRWLTRLFPVKSLLQNYSYVLDALKQASEQIQQLEPMAFIFVLQIVNVFWDYMLLELINLCATKKFADIFKEARKMSDNLGLKYINFPRKRKAPR